jgi:hypothetical protein
MTVAVLLGLWNTAPGRAHDLGAEAKLKDGQVQVEAYFDDNTPAAEARVTVLDVQKNPVAEGRTDTKGHWTFPAPPPGAYQVVVNAGDGHRARVQITIPAEGQAVPPPPPVSIGNPEVVTEAGSQAQVPRTISDGPTRDEFTQSRWHRATFGLVLIAVLGAVFWFILKHSRVKAVQGKSASTREGGGNPP